MGKINSKIEYKNLIGFPQHEGDDILYLKGTDDSLGFRTVSKNELKQDFNVNSMDDTIYNCIVKGKKDLISHEPKNIFTVPVLTSNETTVGNITYITSASSEHNATYSAWKAFTGIYSAETDCWQSLVLPTEESPEWVKIYCGGKDVYPLFFTFSNCGSYTRAMKNFVIEGSNDDEEWITLVDDINYSNIANDTYTYYSSIKYQSFKYFRVVIYTSNATDLVKIGNLQITGYLGDVDYNLYADISKLNPLVYYDDEGIEHIITKQLHTTQAPDSYINVLPHMGSASEQGWTTYEYLNNGYANNLPQNMTNGLTTCGYHVNVGLSANAMQKTKFECDNEFTPSIIRIRNRWDYGSGIAYEAICNWNLRNSSDTIVYKAYQCYRKAQNAWYDYHLDVVKPTTSLTFECYANDNGNASNHNYGRGFEILQKDDNGTQYCGWSTGYIFLDAKLETLVSEKSNFVISQIEPINPQQNDLWLSILDKNRVYKFNGSEWIKTDYIPLAYITYDEYHTAYVYNYPRVDNWFDLTVKSTWKSPELTPVFSKFMTFPHNQQLQNYKFKSYDVVLVNKIPELGYEEGEIAQGFTTNFATNDFRVPSVFVDDKFIGLQIGTYGTGISIVNKTTLTRSNATLNNWRLVFRIW